MKVAIHANLKNAFVIRELLSVWNVSWVSPEVADVVIVYGRKPLDTAKKTILIPSSADSLDCMDEPFIPKTVTKPATQVLVKATPEISLKITPRILYDSELSNRDANDGLIIPQFDFVKEYQWIVQRTLTAKSAAMYRLATSFPFPYNIVPKRVRDRFMKRSNRHENSKLFDVLPMDALRFALANVIEQLSRKKLCRKTWNRRVCVSVLTHDIDTKEGLKKSIRVKKLEENYDVPSAWFVPAKEYSLDHGIIEELENNGEIGSHDTKHDGRLFNLSGKKLNKRLSDSKQTLERLTKHPIEGFRAPLLQHNQSILEGLREAGYSYDSSIPTWETKHPRTMRPHGLGTIYPLSLAGIVEIPLTVAQDHQLLSVVGLQPREVVDLWLSVFDMIKELGGCCVFLSHPEYDLLKNHDISAYEDLLNHLNSDRDAWVTTPNFLADPNRISLS